jgi:hypothetical protein
MVDEEPTHFAGDAAAVKAALRVNSLCISALRAASAEAILHELLGQAAAGTPMFGLEHGVAITKLEVNRAHMAATQLILFYAALNVVVEGWRENNTLVDAEIDGLLSMDALVQALRNYRNSVMHPNPLADPRQIRFAELHSELSKWASRLTNAFLRYFREWRQTFEPA